MHADWAKGGESTVAAEPIFRVPLNVIDILPATVKKILKCDNDQTLLVVRNLDLVDLFAGKARISRWGELFNLQVAALDREFGQHLDLCTDLGFAHTLCTIMRVKTSGLVMMGPQCSSWVWLSRSTTRRSLTNPYGDTSVETVREGNQVNSRVAMICAICSMLGIAWAIEQPASSLFFHTDLMRAIVAEDNAWQRHFFMKAFGHSNSKPTLLFGVANFLAVLGTAFKQKSPCKRRRQEAARKAAKVPRKKRTKVPESVSVGPKAATKPKQRAKTCVDPNNNLCTVKVDPATGKKRVTGKRAKVS